MGVTVHYRGRFADMDRIEDFEDRVLALVLELGGRAEIWRSTADHDPQRMVRGVLAHLHPGQETTSLLISPEGWLVPFFQIEEAEEGTIAEPPWCFVKTQFGPVESHVALVEMLIRLAGDFQIGFLSPLFPSPPILALFIVVARWDYGPMRRAEHRARRTGEVSRAGVTEVTGQDILTLEPSPRGRVFDLALPILVGLLPLAGSVAGGEPSSQPMEIAHESQVPFRMVERRVHHAGLKCSLFDFVELETEGYVGTNRSLDLTATVRVSPSNPDRRATALMRVLPTQGWPILIRGTLNDPSDRDSGWSVEMAFPWKVLAEFAPTMRVILATTGGQRKVTTLAELLPDPFLPENLS